MIPKNEREVDKAICDAAVPDWRPGAVEKDNIYVKATHPTAVGPERVLLRANTHFPYEAEVRAAAHCRNRLPVYIAAADATEARIAALEGFAKKADADAAEYDRSGEYDSGDFEREAATIWRRAAKIMRGET